MRYLELKPVTVEPHEWAKIEARIRAALMKLVYAPMLAELGLGTTLKNAPPHKPTALFDAISAGHLIYRRGHFLGKLSAEVSKELKTLGASWDYDSKSFFLSSSRLTSDLRKAIEASESRFLDTLERIDQRLADISPDELAESVKMASLFDTALWRTQRQISASMKAHAEALKHLSITPRLTRDQIEIIAKDWQHNLQLDIKKFAKKEIRELRENVMRSVFQGDRQEVLAKYIKRSYGVTVRKARFLARQETNLLLAKFRETQYRDAGVQEYRWVCVHMPKDKTPAQHTPGNVRYSHGVLDGKVFRYDTPPITTPPGAPVRRNNPGQDFNCRCHDIPVVRFR